MKRTVYGAVLALLVAFSGAASADTFPSRTLTMVVPFAAGGPTDVLGRIMAQAMGEVLGQQIIVENIGGAGGMTGGKRIADAKPDGYSMLLGTVGTQAQGQTLYKHPLYNAVTDFTPVALIAEVPIVLIARPDFPADNLKDFIAYAKANASKMSFGSAGAGSATHLGCVVANLAMGVDITHVPYKGSAPAMTDLIGGRIDFFCEVLSTAKPLIDSHKVKAIVLMTKQRSLVEPNVPTAEEQGIKGFEAYTWNAIFLPKNTPPDIVKKLNEAAVKAMNSAAVKDRLLNLGATVVPANEQTPAFLGEYVKSEIKKWEVPIKASGVSE